MKPSPASSTSPEAWPLLRGSDGQPLTKVERLAAYTDPYLPEFPLDEDTLAELEPYPGELPTSDQHYCALLREILARPPR
jgi:hypothetical protein